MTRTKAKAKPKARTKAPTLPILLSASADSEGSQHTGAEPNTRIDEGVVAKKAKTCGATEHADGTAKYTGNRGVHQTRELVARTKEDTLPVAKRQRTIREMLDCRDVSEDGGGQHVEPGAPEHGGGIESDGDPARPQELPTASLATILGESLDKDMEQDPKYVGFKLR